MKKLLLCLLLMLPALAQATSACNGRWVEHTRWKITGAHIQNKCTCTNCHQGALIAETAPTTCAGCHAGAMPTAKQMSKTHIPTSAIACESCHNDSNFTPAQTKHSAVSSQRCDTCHNAAYKQAMPSDHVQTILDCAVCHTTKNWVAEFSHDKAKVTPRTCNNCHLSGKNGATKKPNSHFITFESCDVCHDKPWPRSVESGS
ncbi:MAG: hypothetical protein HOP06_00725 [Methylotenera sp.]|nr:hypothetical protein [Methylotenera sp.]